jgi:hypothetical protein
MKILKKILEQVINEKRFFSFQDMDRIFLKIFSSYVDNVVFIKIKENILFIGVKIPQLVAHFTSLKQHILKQFLEEKNFNIIDIKFFYFNYIKKNKQNIKTKEIFLTNKTFEKNKEDIYIIIKKNCPKKEYHDLLYKLYIKSSLYEKK